MPVIPVAEWMPDMPDLSQATSVLSNAIPLTPESYGPLHQMAPYSNALPSACIGAIGVEDTQGGIHMFAGTASTLEKIDGGSPSWANVSASSPVYSVAPGENWRFAQFKDTLLATAWANPIQSFNMNGGTAFATLSSGAPQARHIAIIRSFCMVADTYDSVGGYGPFRSWWSAENDPTTWPTPGSAAAQQVMSDYNDLAGSMGAITGLVGGLAGADGAQFFERAVYRIMWVGPPDIFDFQPAEGVHGTRLPNAIVPVGGVVYYIADDGFYAFDGSTSMAIGVNKVDKWFWSNLNQSYLSAVVGTYDVVNRVIVWVFPSLSAPNGVADTAIFYSIPLQRFGVGSLSAEWVAFGISFGVSMDSMASLGYTNLDTVPYSLDSRVWIGGAPQLAVINTSHQLAYFSGPPLEAQIGSAEAQVFPDQKAFIQAVRPLVDGGSPTVAISTRDIFESAAVFGSDVAMNIIGECPQRATGRYTRARITIPAGAAWTQCRGFDVTAIPAGQR